MSGDVKSTVNRRRAPAEARGLLERHRLAGSKNCLHKVRSSTEAWHGGMAVLRPKAQVQPPPNAPMRPMPPQVRLTKTAGRYVERALQLWLHEEHPEVALHIDHKKQEFKGSQRLAAVGATVFYTGAKHLVDVPPPSIRKA